MTQSESDLWIISTIPPSPDFGDSPVSRGAVTFKDHISPILLQQQLAEFAKGVGHALTGIRELAGGYELHEIEVHAEIGADGKVSMLGSGASASVKGGLKLVFRRKAATATAPATAGTAGA